MAQDPQDRLRQPTRRWWRRGRPLARLCLAAALAGVVGLVLTSLLPAAPSADSTADQGRIHTPAQQARAADRFVDAIGVNTHLHYTDTVYGRFEDIIRPRLDELGVRHVRDGAYTYDGVSADHFYYRRLRELGEAGMDLDLITSIVTPYSERTAVDRLDDVQRWTGGAVTAFEGANEPDLARVDDWVAPTRRLQHDLWSKVGSDPALADVDVIGPSVAFRPDAVGDLSANVHFANWHPYPDGRCPTCKGPYGQSFDSLVDDQLTPTGDRPLMVTETGYHNAVGSDGEHRPASERAAGRYVPRLLLEMFNRRVRRTYLYELIDVRDDPGAPEANFGLLRNDGTRKPAYVAVRNLIRLLDDPGPPFTPGTLRYHLGGDTDGVHHTLLQKRDGTFLLALWQERPGYDTGQRAGRPDDVDARGDVEVAPQSVTVATADSFATVRLHRPGTDEGAPRAWRDASTVRFDVPDEVVVLELVPDTAADD